MSQSFRFNDALATIAGSYDLIISDVWGVVHNGVRAYPPAYEALAAARKAGKVVVLVSNAPRPGSAVIPQLDRLGVSRTAYDHIITSGDVSRALMQQRPEKKVHHIGPQRDLVVFDGLDVMQVPLEEAAYVLITGLVDDSTETPDDYRSILGAIRLRNLPVICGNPDKVVEVGDSLVYCAGALGDLYKEMGGQVIYAGKPFPMIYDFALAYTKEKSGHIPPKSRILCIGDAMRTDIDGANRLGVDSIFLAEGIHGHALLKDGDWVEGALEALVRTSGQTPTFVMKRLV